MKDILTWSHQMASCFNRHWPHHSYDDLYAECLYASVISAPQFKEGNFKAYTTTAMRNAMFDYMKHVPITKMSRFRSVRLVGHSYQDNSVQLVKRRVLDDALQQVPEDRALMTVFKYVHGYTFKEIAGMFKTTYDMAVWYVNDTVKKLRALLVDYKEFLYSL